MKTFRTELQVRGYELDSFGHVNHANYLHYIEFARWRMLEDSGAGVDYFQRHQVAPVVVRVEIDYKAPCFLSEWLVIETTLHEVRTRTARFKHRVLKRDSGVVAAESIMTLVSVDASGKAVALPSDFQNFFGDAESH